MTEPKFTWREFVGGLLFLFCLVPLCLIHFTILLAQKVREVLGE